MSEFCLIRTNPILASQLTTGTLLVAVSVCLTGCHNFDRDSLLVSQQAANVPLKVNVSKVVQAKEAVETVVVYGTLIPVQESRLSFQAGGTVQALRKNVGDVVAKGDVIAYLESDELGSRRKQVLAALKEAGQAPQSPSSAATASIPQNIEQLTRQLREVEAELERRVIVSPFAGVVSEVEVSVGEIAPPTVPVVVVVSDDPPKVAVKVTDEMSSRVLAQNRVWAGIGDRAVELQVESSSEIRSPTSGKMIIFEVQEDLPKGSWEYGDVVELRFRDLLDITGCWVPVNALQIGANNQWSVFVVVGLDGATGPDVFRVERRPVEIQLIQNNRAYVKSSLANDELVVVNGTHRIVEGQRVIPVPAAEQAVATLEQGVRD